MSVSGWYPRATWLKGGAGVHVRASMASFRDKKKRIHVLTRACSKLASSMKHSHWRVGRENAQGLRAKMRTAPPFLYGVRPISGKFATSPPNPLPYLLDPSRRVPHTSLSSFCSSTRSSITLPHPPPSRLQDLPPSELRCKGSGGVHFLVVQPSTHAQFLSHSNISTFHCPLTRLDRPHTMDVLEQLLAEYFGPSTSTERKRAIGMAPKGSTRVSLTRFKTVSRLGRLLTRTVSFLSHA